MSDLENEFYKDLPGIKDRIFAELMKLKYYRSRPDRVLGFWIGDRDRDRSAGGRRRPVARGPIRHGSR